MPLIERLRHKIRRFAVDDQGAVVVDFIPEFFAMVVLVLFVFEIGIAYFLSLRAYKAAQLGARVAVVTQAVHEEVPPRNLRSNPVGMLGEPCFNPNGPDRCFGTAGPGGPWVCDGSALSGSCDSTRFRQIVNDMRRTFPDLGDDEVRITYIYRGLGETGGPFVPEVNVQIQPQAYQFLVLAGLGGGGRSDNNPATRYGGVSASAFGESTDGLNLSIGVAPPPVATN